MAQSRPTTTTDGGKALAKTIVDLQKRVRTLELREDPPTGGGGGSGAWCQIDFNSGWADGSGVSAYGQIGNTSIWDQSGGFTTPDAQTIALPEGLYVVEWSFNFVFLFTNPYTHFTGTGWAEWSGGALAVTNSVRNYTVNDEHMIAPVEFVDYGGGDAGMQTLNGQQDLIVWRGIVQASGSNVNLALGIRDFRDFFPAALDWSADFNAPLMSADNGGGHHNVWIGSIGS